MGEDDWERRVAEVWAGSGELADEELLAAVDELALCAPPGTGVGDFERACAQDSTGHSDLAVPLYRSALDLGLDPVRQRRAIIQMASSLRNMGQAREAVAMLRAERARTHDQLDAAVTAFLALALADTGGEREAAGLALEALAEHLPRYQRSLANYARELIPPGSAP
jgi:hypothetical protein